MKEFLEKLSTHKRVGRGWTVYSITPTSNLRFYRGVLQQECTVKWRHDVEQHVGGGYYDHFDMTSEWLDVPTIEPAQDTPL
jgi:hypothetical protein